MKLRYSQTSPYVRKVVVCAAELGLSERIELTPSGPRNVADVRQDNPLGKVPALLTDAGEALYDSPVICEYLDSLHDGEALFPVAGEARWRALRQQALGDDRIQADQPHPHGDHSAGKKGCQQGNNRNPVGAW